MNPETYDQVAVPKDIVGDGAAYLQDGMPVMLSRPSTACRSPSSCRSG